MKLFEYVIIHHPRQKKSDHEEGRAPRSVLAVPIQQVMAKDVNEVNMVAARAIPAELTTELDRVEIVVRPF